MAELSKRNQDGELSDLNVDFMEVAPRRLNSGHWCHQRASQVGEGDIHAAYSADRIGAENKIRKPFRLRGWLWTTVGMSHRGGHTTAKAYRLLSPAEFDGEPTSYSEKNHEDARGDPLGFYHGMEVSHGGHTYVLTGPPVQMVPGAPEPTQATLF